MKPSNWVYARRKPKGPAIRNELNVVRVWLLPDRCAGDGQPAAKAAGPHAATRSRARSDEDAVAVQSRRQHHARRPGTARPEPDRDDTAGQVPARQRATVAAVRVDHVHV